ncbi:MAG: amylo-alpha-1,6-glucosidase [bacterium]
MINAKQLIEDIKSLKDERGFICAGLPRFNRLFGRDALITAWQLLIISPDIARSTLKVLAEFQGKIVNNENEEEPGKILHEAKGYFPYNYYGSVDSTPLFLIVAGLYFAKTKDINFLKEYWNNIRAAAKWMINYGDRDNDLFIEYQQKTFGGLYHQGWKDSFKDELNILAPVAIVEVQGYAYFAFCETAKLAEAVGEKEFSQLLNDKAGLLKEKFNKSFWMDKEKYFCLGLDRKKEQRLAITSNPGQLLFTGIVDEEKVGYVVTALFSKELWTPYGIRTCSTKEPDFNPLSYHLGSVWPHDNWIIAQGLKKQGYKKEYEKVKAAITAAYEEISFIPEFYGVVKDKISLATEKTPSHPQAWASGALLNFFVSK